MGEDLSWFSRGLRARLSNYLSLKDDQVRLLYSHYQALLRWNSKMNLTSIRLPEEILVRHYCESLFFGIHIPAMAPRSTVVDVGSGAGFPGVPLSVIRPDCEITLVESNTRKAVFLRESTREIGNISVIGGRGEDLSGRYSWIVSRAVNPLDIIALTPRLSTRVGLLIGEKDWQKIQKIAGIVWGAPVPVPWGERTLCVYGERST